MMANECFLVSVSHPILWGKGNKPNDITPMAWKTPSLMMMDPFSGPLDSAGAKGPWVTMVMRMRTMLINAKVLAFAS